MIWIYRKNHNGKKSRNVFHYKLIHWGLRSPRKPICYNQLTFLPVSVSDPILIMPSFLFYRWWNWLLQGHTSRSLSLDPKVGLHVGTYRYVYAGTEHIIFLTPIETTRIICSLECSASLIPLSVQPSTRARILLTFRGEKHLS